jgi:hypothetical protein
VAVVLIATVILSAIIPRAREREQKTPSSTVKEENEKKKK